MDALPFRQYFEQHYGSEIGKKKKQAKKADAADDKVRRDRQTRLDGWDRSPCVVRWLWRKRVGCCGAEVRIAGLWCVTI